MNTKTTKKYDWKLYHELTETPKYGFDTYPVGNGDNIAHVFSPKSTHNYYWLCRNLERAGLGHRLSPDGTVTVIFP